jgi:hypothetical protein
MKKLLLVALMATIGATAQTLGEAGTNTTVQGTNVNIKGGADGTTRVTGGVGGVVIGSSGKNTTITGATTTINTSNTNITGDVAQIKSKTVNVGKLDATVTVDGLDTRLNSQKTTVAGSFIVGSAGDPRTGQNGIYQLNTSGTTAARIDRNGTISVIGTGGTEASPKFNVDGKSGVLESKADIRTSGSITSNGINNSGQKITGVANGTAATDAVNVSQLNVVQNKLDTQVERLDAIIDTKADKVQVAQDIQQAKREAIRISNEYTDEKIMEVNYKVDKEVTRLDGRIDATNNVVEANKKEAADATAKVQSNLDKESKRLDMRIDTETQRVESKLNQRITEVDLRLNNRIDAVMTYVGNEFKAVNNRIEGLGASMVALSAAASSQIYSPSKPTNVNIGTGFYGKATAIAVGMSHYFNSQTKLSVNYAASSNTKNLVGIGAGFSF